MIAPHDVADIAVELGGEGAVALVHVSSEADLRWANSMLTTNGERVSTTLTVLHTCEVPGGIATGLAAAPVRDRHDIASLCERARTAARESTPAADAMPLVSGIPGARDWTDEVDTTSGQAFGAIAPALGAAFAQGRSDGIEHFGYAEHEVATTFLASSTGLRLRHCQATARLEATAKSHARSRSAWAGRGGVDLLSFDVEAIDQELRRGLQWQAHTIDWQPGRYNTVLSPSAVADLLIYQHWTASARDAADGRTVFSRPGGGTRVGDQLTSAPVRLSSNPHDTELSCTPFATSPWGSALSSAFDLGLALHPTDWIVDGQLRSLVSSRHVAAELGVEPHPMIDNLRLEHRDGVGSLDDLIARTDEGILVTCLWYIREVDPQTLLLTGLTRDGVYLIRDGAVAGSVGNFRFNMSPVDVLANITDAGETSRSLPREWADYFTRTATPALRVAQFNFSTRSDAL